METNSLILFDTSLNELASEADNLFEILEKISISLSNLEKRLVDSKAFFPHELIIITGEESIPRPPEQRHIDGFPFQVQGYTVRLVQSLSWESDETTKKYRLFLIIKEEEIIHYYTDTDSYLSTTFQFKCIYKKALIENDLATKIKCSEHIIPFMNSFREYLKKCRIAIKNGNDIFF